jgi:GNAT superfamily N-acetyltransferase
MSPVQVVRIEGELPQAFERLRAEAAAEGFDHIERLASEWAAGEQRFDKPGEALFAVFVDGELAGVGAVSREHLEPQLGAMRMRRCYVRRVFRRAGVGRALAGAMIQQGLQSTGVLTVNAGTPDAPAFWAAMGFAQDARNGRTHVLRSPADRTPQSPP